MASDLQVLPFQLEDIQFISDHNGSALVAEPPGCGKTIIALNWLKKNPQKGLPAVVVCPASLKINWKREARKWTNFRVEVIDGRRGHLPKVDLYIVNYDVLGRMRQKRPGKKVKYIKGRSDQLEGLGIKTLVLDECQLIRDRLAKRTRAVMRLAETVRNVIGLSGTPIVNRPAEFFPILSIIAPDLFPSFWKFAKRYCSMYFDGFRWNYRGATRTKELHQILTEHVMIRHRKEDVLPQLPKKQRIVLPLEIPPRSEYWDAEADFQDWLEQRTVFRASLVRPRFNTLLQLAALEKLRPAAEWIANYLDQGEKLVVFCVNQEVTDQLDVLLEKYKPIVMDGRTPMHRRQAMVDAFQQRRDLKLIMGSPTPLGVGWTLTKASATCFVQMLWSSEDHKQAEDRVHRYTQDADHVFAYYLVAANTVDEDMIKLLDKKASIISKIMDGHDVKEDDILEDLYHRRRNHLGVAAK